MLLSGETTTWRYMEFIHNTMNNAKVYEIDTFRSKSQTKKGFQDELDKIIAT